MLNFNRRMSIGYGASKNYYGGEEEKLEGTG